MNREAKRAIRAAIKQLERRKQVIAFDANVQRYYKVNTAYAVRCLEEYEQIGQQIEELERLMDGAQQMALF